MTPVLLTGAAGFIGSRLVERLARAGVQVYAVAGPHENIPHRAGVTPIFCDLRRPALLLSAIEDFSAPLTMVHLAWNTQNRRDLSLQSEQVAIFTGLLASLHGRLNYLVVAGSAEEFGSRNGVLSDNDPPKLPLSPYGWAKVSVQIIAESWALTTGAGLTWLRPFVVYGPGQAGNMLIPYAVRCARQNVRADFTDGLQIRDFIYVEDVVEAFFLAVTKGPNGIQKMNIGTGEATRIVDVVCQIGQLFGAGKHFRTGTRSRGVHEPDFQVADITTARRLLAWQPRISLKEGLAIIHQETSKPD